MACWPDKEYWAQDHSSGSMKAGARLLITMSPNASLNFKTESPIRISPVCFFLVFSVRLLVRINHFINFGNEIAEMWQCWPINIKRSENKEYLNDQTASSFTREKKEKIKIYTWKNILISALTLGLNLMLSIFTFIDIFVWPDTWYSKCPYLNVF